MCSRVIFDMQVELFPVRNTTFIIIANQSICFFPLKLNMKFVQMYLQHFKLWASQESMVKF